jgi:hypothetical protein
LLNSFLVQSYKSEPPWAVTNVVEGFALVMLCHCRLSVRRLAVHILKEAKTLVNILSKNYALLLKAVSNLLLCRYGKLQLAESSSD